MICQEFYLQGTSLFDYLHDPRSYCCVVKLLNHLHYLYFNLVHILAKINIISLMTFAGDLTQRCIAVKYVYLIMIPEIIY